MKIQCKDNTSFEVNSGDWILYDKRRNSYDIIPTKGIPFMQQPPGITKEVFELLLQDCKIVLNDETDRCIYYKFI